MFAHSHTILGLSLRESRATSRGTVDADGSDSCVLGDERRDGVGSFADQEMTRIDLHEA